MTTAPGHTGRRLAALAALAAVTAAWAACPPAPASAVGPRPSTHVPVALHVHTIESDGTGTREVVAAAAARAGVAAAVLTDHGDGRRSPRPPAHVGGVLLLDGVEISTWSGHYAALGAAPAPYPLGGEPRAVVEDVARLGGFGIAAHPGSAKDDLRWRDWDAPIDGIEWLNGDSVWRARPRRLWRTALGYPFRPIQALTALVERPSFELEQWDRLTTRRPVVGLVAHDAHARLGLRGLGEPYGDGLAVPLPGYDVVFGSFVNVAVVAAPLTGEAVSDAAAVSGALRRGRVYAVLTGIAPSGRVHFEATSGAARATMGEHLVPVGAVSWRFRADVPAGAVSVLLCEGREVARAAGGRLEWQHATGPGACRVEVRVAWDGAERPWLVTNPIYARAVLTVAAPATPPVQPLAVVGEGGPAAWAVETAADATARVASGPDATLDFEWRLGPAADTFAAIQTTAPPGLASATAVMLRVAADRPRRLWVQLRAPDGGGQRWGASFYADETPRDVTVPMAAMVPFGDAATTRVALDRVTAVLIVTDTVHAVPGSAGTIRLAALRLAR
ncbi:MAG: hypothetical protein AB7U83_19185 [Vicinamibacterales bacterium]